MEGTTENFGDSPHLSSNELTSNDAGVSSGNNSADAALATGEVAQDGSDSSASAANLAQENNSKKSQSNIAPVFTGLPEPVVNDRDPVQINLRSLLQAGAHFGHQTSRWSPAMAPYIYTSRNGIHIIDLPKTVRCWETARQAIVDVVSRGGSVLFVGTKKQAEKSIVEEATRCGQFYVARRWLGGMMTNFQTIRRSIERMNKLEATLLEEEEVRSRGESSQFKKKERLMMSRELEKLHFSLSGIRNMYGPPQLMFVIDIKREDIAIKEAKRLDIPVIALVDTNCNPDHVTHAIPSNDDGTRAIGLFTAAVADAVMEGKSRYQETASLMEVEAAAKASDEDGTSSDASSSEDKGEESTASSSSDETPTKEESTG